MAPYRIGKHSKPQSNKGQKYIKNTQNIHHAGKGVRQKELGKKVTKKSDRNIRKSDQKVTERVPKTKKVIEHPVLSFLDFSVLLSTIRATPWGKL